MDHLRKNGFAVRAEDVSDLAAIKTRHGVPRAPGRRGVRSPAVCTVLPESIGALQRLAKLDLEANKLTELPDALGNCSALRVLNVSNNRLISLPPSLATLGALVRENKLSFCGIASAVELNLPIESLEI